LLSALLAVDREQCCALFLILLPSWEAGVPVETVSGLESNDENAAGLVSNGGIGGGICVVAFWRCFDLLRAILTPFSHTFTQTVVSLFY
jgi:hypothetical protein